MSKKFNNKYLLIAFAALVALFVFVKFYRSVMTERTLKTDIINIDTAKVTRILLYPQAEKGKELVFLKKGTSWSISDGKLETETGKGMVKNILNQLLDIKAKRLVARSKDKWAEYQLTDTSATRIKVFEGDKESLNIYIGKFTYQQSNDPYGGYGRGGGVIGTSYVRLANEKEIYAVDGFLTFAFNQSFNNWRNQTFVELNQSNVSKLTFRYPADSSFVLSKENKKWMVNGAMADSAKVLEYLNSLSNKNASTFDDEFTPIGNSQYQLTIEGNNMSNITVDGFTKSENEFKINSTLNSKAWFSSDRKGLFKDIFKGKKDFMEGKKKK